MKKIMYGVLLLLAVAYGGFMLQSMQFKAVTPEQFVYPPLNAEKLSTMVDDWRTSEGFAVYKPSVEMCEIANKRLSEIKTDFSHNKFLNNDYCVECAIAENLSRGHETELATLNAWLNSDTHRGMLEDSYTHACLVTDNHHAVQIFGYR